MEGKNSIAKEFDCFAARNLGRVNYYNIEVIA